MGFESSALRFLSRALYSGVTRNVVEQSREEGSTSPREGDTAGPASWLTALGHAQTLQGGLLEVQDWTAGLKTGMGRGRDHQRAVFRGDSYWGGEGEKPFHFQV